MDARWFQNIFLNGMCNYKEYSEICITEISMLKRNYEKFGENHSLKIAENGFWQQKKKFPQIFELKEPYLDVIL